MNSVSVVTPVYNAELSLGSLYDQLLPFKVSTTNQFEVIMIEGLRNAVCEIRIFLINLAEGNSASECRLNIHRLRIKAIRCAYKDWKAPVRSFFKDFLVCNKSAILRLHLVDCFKGVTGCVQL